MFLLTCFALLLFSIFYLHLALKQNCLWTNKYIHALETTVNQQPVSQVPRVYCREGITMTCYQIGKHEVCIHQSGYYFNLIEQSAHCSENVCAANRSQQGGQQYRDKVHSIVVENVKSWNFPHCWSRFSNNLRKTESNVILHLNAHGYGITMPVPEALDDK